MKHLPVPEEPLLRMMGPQLQDENSFDVCHWRDCSIMKLDNRNIHPEFVLPSIHIVLICARRAYALTNMSIIICVQRVTEQLKE
jgi:hypothetical protein